MDRMPSFVSFDDFLKCRQFETFYAWHDLCGRGGNISNGHSFLYGQAGGKDVY